MDTIQEQRVERMREIDRVIKAWHEADNLAEMHDIPKKLSMDAILVDDIICAYIGFRNDLAYKEG